MSKVDQQIIDALFRCLALGISVNVSSLARNSGLSRAAFHGRINKMKIQLQNKD